MRPYEILKSNIDDAITTLNRINGDGKLDYADYEEMFDAISTITDGVDFPTASPWHRVEDELPEIGHSILIWAGGVAMIGKRTDDDMFQGKRYFLIEADGYNYWERVESGMCWMPIEPPQEDADEP